MDNAVVFTCRLNAQRCCRVMQLFLGLVRHTVHVTAEVALGEVMAFTTAM